MQYVVVGMFGSYGDAEGAVRDLELAGIVGEQVEVITDIDHDWRTANIPGEPSTESHQHEVVDDPGEQPNYIGAQEYYANHVKQGGAVTMFERLPSYRQIELPQFCTKMALTPRGTKTVLRFTALSKNPELI